MTKVILRTPMRTRVTLFRTHFFVPTFSDALFKAWTVAPSVGLLVYLVFPLPFPCFQVSAPPRLKNPDSDKKDALFSLDTQIIIVWTVQFRSSLEKCISNLLPHFCFLRVCGRK
jgi:hypothetical protein